MREIAAAFSGANIIKGILAFFLIGNLSLQAQVAYYPFNGNANDESGHGHNAVANTATLTTDRFGNPNSAYEFNASIGSYIMVPDHDELDPLNDFTLAFWFNPTSYANTGGQIINKYRAYINNEGAWAAQLDPSHLGLSAANGFFSTTVIPLNKWTFGTIVFTKSTNTWSIYLNGQLDASGVSAVVIKNNVRNLYIGIHEGESYGNFNGKIDDIRIFHTALGISEIQSLYHEGGWNQSNTVTDIEGNGYNTVSIGTQVWMAENLKTTKYNDGSSIPLVTAAFSWETLTTPAYCWYNNDPSTYKTTYGAL